MIHRGCKKDYAYKAVDQMLGTGSFENPVHLELVNSVGEVVIEKEFSDLIEGNIDFTLTEEETAELFPGAYNVRLKYNGYFIKQHFEEVV